MPPPDDALTTSPLVVLSWERGEQVLPDGEYVIGRGSGADVLIDEPRVSRRHARLEVDGTDVHIVDEGSRNGVYVNGRPVRRSQALADGDVILVGGAELKLRVERTERERRIPSPRPAQMRISVADEDEDDGATSRSTTKTFDDLELIGRVADQALAAGHPREAERMLEAHLRRVLEDLSRGRDVSPITVDRAFGHALKLAAALHRGAWFDLAVDVLRSARVVCSESMVAELVRVKGVVDRIDAARLKRYIDVLRTDGPSMESLRAAQRLHELLLGGRRG